MKHPGEVELALYAASDLGFWRKLRLGRHVRGCASCRREVEGFRATGETLSGAANELPEDIHWGRLAAEMKANIRLGLAAGACLPPAREALNLSAWRQAAALASVTLLTAGAWWLSGPRPHPAAEPVARGAVVLKTTAGGIELEKDGGALALVHSGAVTLSVGAQGSLNARYVDQDTGEVTIHRVYAE